MLEPSEKRRLAAVMFLDMVGYSALMSRDEAKALSCVKRLEDILRAEIPKSGGRLVKLLGDGSLAEFSTAASAVSCARKILAVIASANASRPIEERFAVRIGLHLGDLVEKGGDIFGDAVNIAARIQPLADPGGIAMSAVVQAQVKNQLPPMGLLLAPQKLKNIPEKVSVFVICPPEASYILWRWQRLNMGDISKIAALAALALGLGLWTQRKAQTPPPPAKPQAVAASPSAAVSLKLASKPVSARPIAAPKFQPAPAAPARAYPVEEESPAINLKVRVEGILNVPGEIGIALFNRKRGYPIHIQHAYQTEWVLLTAGQSSVTVAFEDLPPGDYAISAVHDENANRLLERSETGFPKEGVAFSNGARVTLKAPSFESARFSLAVGKSQEIVIPMDYQHRPQGRR